MPRRLSRGSVVVPPQDEADAVKTLFEPEPQEEEEEEEMSGMMADQSEVLDILLDLAQSQVCPSSSPRPRSPTPPAPEPEPINLCTTTHTRPSTRMCTHVQGRRNFLKR